MKNEECNQAIRRVFEKIKINEIKKFIDNVECLSKARKEFYYNMISQRYEIIKIVYEQIKENEII